MSRKWIFISGAALLAVLGLGVAAWASPAGKGETQGQGEKHGQGGWRGRVLYGQLTAASGSNWTVKPELPPKLKERLEARAAEKGVELPALPDSISVAVSDESKFWLDGQSAAAADFNAGDEVVIKLDKSWKETGASIMGAADSESARQYICAKMDKQRGEGGGKGGKRGKGERGGPGGRRPHPAFGVVTAVSADSITIKPEVPDFIKAQMEEREKMREQRQQERGGEGKGKGEGKGRGDKPRRELPSELIFKLSDATVYVVNEDEQSSNPFKVGDRVGILPQRPEGGPDGGPDGGPGEGGPGEGGPGMGGPGDDGRGGPEGGEGPREMKAGVVSDYASAEARMKEMHEKMKEHRKGRGGEGRQGGHGEGEGGAE